MTLAPSCPVQSEREYLKTCREKPPETSIIEKLSVDVNGKRRLQRKRKGSKIIKWMKRRRRSGERERERERESERERERERERAQ